MYTQLVLKEIEANAGSFDPQPLTSVYFGGGTPSLLPPNDILNIYKKITTSGSFVSSSTEVTVEINPGTISEASLDEYLGGGINRFSVGLQTFNDKMLRHLGREHSSLDTKETLKLLSRNSINFSVDILFGLPNQSLVELKEDLLTALSFNPSHVSAYCLTLPKDHFLNAGRASNAEQADMFELISEVTQEHGIFKYEVSNYARPGFESQHNLLYWSDQPYWGVGVSSHSYLPQLGPWGTRFWNPRNLNKYSDQVSALSSSPAILKTMLDAIPSHQKEELKLHESLTDFCHTFLRKLKGLSVGAARDKYGELAHTLLYPRLSRLKEKGLLDCKNDQYKLSPLGQTLTNQVFLELTFLASDV